MCIERNTETHSCHNCCSGKGISIIYSECVFVVLGMQHAIRMRHTVICGTPRLYSVFPHYLM